MKCSSLSESGATCPEDAVAVVHWPGQDRPRCAAHLAQAQNVASAMGFALSSTPINPVYEKPTLTALGPLEDLIRDRAEAVRALKEILRHGEHVVGGILPGIVLHEGLKWAKALVDRLEPQPPASPAPPPSPSNPVAVAPSPAPSAGLGGAVPGFAHCRHGVPSFITCGACAAECGAVDGSRENLAGFPCTEPKGHPPGHKHTDALGRVRNEWGAPAPVVHLDGMEGPRG